MKIILCAVAGLILTASSLAIAQEQVRYDGRWNEQGSLRNHSMTLIPAADGSGKAIAQIYSQILRCSGKWPAMIDNESQQLVIDRTGTSCGDRLVFGNIKFTENGRVLQGNNIRLEKM